MMTKIRHATREEMIEELRRLVERSGLTLDELKRRGAIYNVSVEQRDILNAVEQIEFLLSNE